MWNDATNKDLICYALRMWINYITTGDIALTPNDCKAMKQPNKIQALDIDQLKFIVRLSDIIEKIERKPKND